jgi:hypothetical protein
MKQQWWCRQSHAIGLCLLRKLWLMCVYGIRVWYAAEFIV